MQNPTENKDLTSNFAFLSLLIFLTLGLIFLPQNAQAGKIADYFADEDPGRGPFPRRNQTPLLNLFYLPEVNRAETLGLGRMEFRVDFEASNIFEANANNNFGVIFDQEIYRTSFHFTYGLFKNLDFSP